MKSNLEAYLEESPPDCDTCGNTMENCVCVDRYGEYLIEQIKKHGSPLREAAYIKPRRQRDNWHVRPKLPLWEG